MTPEIYNFQDQYKGTTFDACKFTVTKTIDGVTTITDLTDVEIRIDFKRRDKGSAVWSLSIGNGITVLDAVNGVFVIDSFINNYPAFNYVYDIKMIFPSDDPEDDPRVYLKGNYKIYQNITN